MDSTLYKKFKEELLAHTPRPSEQDSQSIVNHTKLLDLTEDIIQCARGEYGIELTGKLNRIFGKFDSSLQTGSIKERPAYNIINQAILDGKINSGGTVIEATSGNFGISLGHLTKVGLKVLVLISRKLQDGVKDELKKNNVQMIDLDIDICPAPGMKGSLEELTAKITGDKIKFDLKNFGYDISIYEKHISEIEALLATQDIINLAKYLAKIYGFFCPQQYDNELNYKAHKYITGPEIDNDLKAQNLSLQDFDIVTSFGTGGTSYGLSEYLSDTYDRKGLHIIFPILQQDVAGIRGRRNASGLTMFAPEKYKGIYEVDFVLARRTLQYFVERGFNIGESSALELYAAIQLANFGVAENLVVILADGIEKYLENYEKHKKANLEIGPEEIKNRIEEYEKVLWVHGKYTLTSEGKKTIQNYLGINPNKLIVAKLDETRDLLEKEEIDKELFQSIQNGNTLVLCRSGVTSLKATEILTKNNIQAKSLQKGITYLAEKLNKQIEEVLIDHELA